MSEKFRYDVFLCHSSSDLAVAHTIAQRLKADGLNVWFRDWQLATDDDNIQQIEEGLECSRILVFLMSAAAFSSHWPQLEDHTFRFRDPLNNARRFIPVRLDDAPIPSSLSQLLYINWSKEPEQAYAKLLEACLLQTEERRDVEAPAIAGKGQVRWLRCGGGILSYAFSADGRRALTGVKDKTVRVWDISTGYCLLKLKGHNGKIWAVDWTTDELIAISGSDDTTIRVWDLKARQCVHVLRGHTDVVRSVAIDGNNRWALSGSDDGSVRAWELTTGNCLRIFKGHTGGIRCIVFDHEQGLVISGGEDYAVRLWDLNTGHCIRVLTGHDNIVASVAVSMEHRLVLSGAHDKTLRLWDLNTGQCLRILEGHTGPVKSITWSADQRFVLSGAENDSLKVWDIETGRSLLALPNRTANLQKSRGMPIKAKCFRAITLAS